MDATADAPGCPFTIDFTTEVLVEIHQSALAAFRSLPYGGLEIGGVLFGRVSPGGRSPRAIEVLANRRIECDHAAGPAFVLSCSERITLMQLFERARLEPGLASLAVVGFWVSHGRSELGLTAHDADLYRALFPLPWQIALVLRPENGRPVREALFCRVEGKVVPYQRPAEDSNAPAEMAVREPSFATEIYLPTPPVEPPSENAWAKYQYRPVGRARPVFQPVPVSDLEPPPPRPQSYWETAQTDPSLELDVCPAPGFTRANGKTASEIYIAPQPRVKAELESPPDAIRQIRDEISLLLNSIRAAAAEARGSQDLAKHDRFGVKMMIAVLLVGALIGGALAFLFFGNHQPYFR